MPDPQPRSLSCIWDFKTAIVTKIASLNLAGLGANVFADRISKIWPDEETICIVNIPNVTFEDNRSSPRFYVTTGDMNIDVYSRANVADFAHTNGTESTSNIADYIDNIAKSIITSLETTVKVGHNGDITRFYLKSLVNNLSEDEAARGMCRIVFGCEWSIVINRTSPADEFLKAKNELSLGSGNANKQEFVTNVRPVTGT